MWGTVHYLSFAIDVAEEEDTEDDGYLRWLVRGIVCLESWCVPYPIEGR